VSNTINKDQNQSTMGDYVANEYNNGDSSISMPHPLSESWDVHFLPVFLAGVQPAQDISRDIYNVIFRLAAQATPSSALYHACNAVGSGFLARKTRSINAVPNHARAYGTALAKLRIALQHPHDVKSDNTLLAIWILSLYEVSINLIYEFRELLILRVKKFIHNEQDGMCSSAWLSHNRVTRHLIDLRGPEQFSRQDARDLFLAILSNTVLHLP
jgi:hypothetical protein